MTARADIRTALRDLIQPHFKTAFDHRTFAIEADDLPTALVSFDAGDYQQDHDDEYDVSAMITIEIIVSGRGNLDEKLDELAEQVNTSIRDQNQLGGLVLGIRRAGFSYDPDPETLTAALSLSYYVTYEEN